MRDPSKAEDDQQIDADHHRGESGKGDRRGEDPVDRMSGSRGRRSDEPDGNEDRGRGRDVAQVGRPLHEDAKRAEQYRRTARDDGGPPEPLHPFATMAARAAEAREHRWDRDECGHHDQHSDRPEREVRA